MCYEANMKPQIKANLPPIVFEATLPEVQGAIQISGHCNGMRIQLEIPQSEIGSAYHVCALQRKRFLVTIEELID